MRENESLTTYQQRHDLTDYLNSLLLDTTLETSIEIDKESNKKEQTSLTEIQNKAHVIKNFKSERAIPTDTRYFIAQIGLVRYAFPLLQLRHLIFLNKQPLPRMNQKQNDFYGFIRYEEKSIPVFSLQTMINDNTASSKALKSNYAMLLEDWPIAIACDTAEEIQKVPADEISWRQRSLKNAWHAGVIRHTMISIIDLNRISPILLSVQAKDSELA